MYSWQHAVCYFSAEVSLSLAFACFRMVDGQVKVNVAFPGLPIQFSTDSGATWTDWRDGTKVDKSTLFATRSVSGGGGLRAFRVSASSFAWILRNLS